jgi:hypothetical protein
VYWIRQFLARFSAKPYLQKTFEKPCHFGAKVFYGQRTFQLVGNPSKTFERTYPDNSVLLIRDISAEF